MVGDRKSWFGLLPALIGAAIPTMMQVGPDDAVLNFCKWPRKFTPSLAENCLPWVSADELYIFAIVLLAGGLIWLTHPFLKIGTRQQKMAVGLALLFFSVGMGIWGLSIIAAGDRPAIPSGHPTELPNPFSGLSNPQLRTRTLSLARELRDLENNYSRKEEAVMNQHMAAQKLPIQTEEQAVESRKLFQEMTNATTRLSSEKRDEYRKRYHVEANQIYEELCRRLKLKSAEPLEANNFSKTGLSPLDFAGISVMRTGSLAGAKPLNYIADAFERLASGL